jgi:hypothetical protein
LFVFDTLLDKCGYQTFSAVRHEVFHAQPQPLISALRNTAHAQLQPLISALRNRAHAQSQPLISALRNTCPISTDFATIPSQGRVATMFLHPSRRSRGTHVLCAVHELQNAAKLLRAVPVSRLCKFWCCRVMI